MRLILVRHGETDWNEQRRYQGQTDVPLNGNGKHQAKRLAHRLRSEEIHAVYASDLQRAWDTAIAVVAYHGVKACAEPRLREIHFGLWEGLTYGELHQRFPEVLSAWQKDSLRVTVPDGEPMMDLVTRVGEVLDQISYTMQGRTVLLVAHGGTLQVMLCLALGLPPGARQHFLVSPASISELHLYEEGPVLVSLNDTHHLRERMH